MFSPTGYVAHYGKAYRSGAVHHWEALPVTSFKNNKAVVCSPSGHLHAFDDATLLRELGLQFMEVTRSGVEAVPDRGDL
jgi:hypothetical protein